MTRNWEAEWVELSGRERRAFERRQRAMDELARTFMRRGEPAEPQIVEAEDANLDWVDVQEAIKRFMEDVYRWAG